MLSMLTLLVLTAMVTVMRMFASMSKPSLDVHVHARGLNTQILPDKAVKLNSTCAGSQHPVERLGGSTEQLPPCLACFPASA